MSVETHIISLKTKSDVTPDFLAQIQSKDSCAGTFQKIGDCEYPCLGGGMIVKSYEQKMISVSHADHKAAVGILKNMMEEKAEQLEFGDVNPKAMVDTIICRPLSVSSCPCVKSQRVSDYDKSLLADLGIEKIPPLYENQKAALAAFKEKKMSLFIYGESQVGKTVLAAACAVGYHRKVKVLIGDEISAEWRRKAFDNQPLDYEGLLILDDVDKTIPTDAFKEKLWYIFDRVTKKKLRLIITTNMTPRAFAARYAQGEDGTESMIARLNKFEAVEL
jgi:hypothetical protein